MYSLAIPPPTATDPDAITVLATTHRSRHHEIDPDVTIDPATTRIRYHFLK